MPLSGFVCPLDGSRVEFSRCKYDCKVRCIELPILLSLMESRDVVPGVYSVTEILRPPRIVNYNRQVEHYSSPFDLMFMQLGTAFHTIVEGQQDLCPGHLFERQLYFESPVNLGERVVILRGQPDQYWDRTETLTDYKTSGWYGVKMLMEGDWSDPTYKLQANLYRRHKFPRCKRMQLVMLIRDYSRRLKHEGIPPLVTINVPWVEDSELDVETKIRLLDILKGEDDWRNSRDCTDEERWKHKKSGEFIRCEDYCLVKDECPQWGPSPKASPQYQGR